MGCSREGRKNFVEALCKVPPGECPKQQQSRPPRYILPLRPRLLLSENKMRCYGAYREVFYFFFIFIAISYLSMAQQSWKYLGTFHTGETCVGTMEKIEIAAVIHILWLQFSISCFGNKDGTSPSSLKWLLCFHEKETKGPPLLVLLETFCWNFVNQSENVRRGKNLPEKHS